MNKIYIAPALMVVAACYRASGVPSIPLTVPDAADSSDVALARALAPVLYVQRDEYFPLDRVVAVIHPSRPVIAYALAWRWDIHGQWVPWSKTSDGEEVWVGYDPATHAPTDLWTFWHGVIIHTTWRDKGQPAVSVDWGTHGSLPHGVIESDLPALKKLNVLYALKFILLPDIWLGKLVHGGPWGFFHGYARYREFTRILPLSGKLSAVVRTANPDRALRAVFGGGYAKKPAWPEDRPAINPTQAQGVSKER